MKFFRKLKSRLIVLIPGLLVASLSYASFIETTMGTAVVNDATAAYFNPAVLVLLKNTQIIPLGTVARFRTTFTGQSTTVGTGFTQSGTSNSTSNYYSPSLYVGMPVNDRMTLGFAAVSNYANRNPEENSILRYVQSGNTIQDYDFVPSVGVRINKYLSLGAGINFSFLKFSLHPIVGFPGTNIADGQGNNQSNGSGIGGNIGFLLQPAVGTLIGFNYRTVTTYRESGTSTYTAGSTQISSNNYHFEVRTPARSVLSISQAVTPTFGLITTVQRFQSSITRNTNVYGAATAIGITPVIVNASVPYYLRNTWLLTLGGNYRFKPDWIVRIAGTYNQSPGNGHYQITTGNSYILGASLGYDVNKTLTLDGSYAHAFIPNENININGNRFLIAGKNQGSRDVVSLKVTLNV